MTRSRLSVADRQTNPLTRLILGLLTWLIVLIFFFPVFWMAVTGFKQEKDANTTSPHLFFAPTLAEYKSVWKGAGGLNGLRPYLEHSILVSIGSTLIVLALAIPAAYALSIRPVRKWRDVLFFFISTKMLPVVGAIIPLFIVARDLHLLDHQKLLVILYTAMNLPIAVWMMRSFLLEVPTEVIEASRVDGAGVIRQLRSVILPIVRPGVAATALICFIFAWNEFFLAVNLTTIACLPVLIAGWAAQDKLVRGLSMGAVK
jgi:sorbitol/mannitol transport system permease protein